MPLVHAEVRVEVVRERVPRDLPAHPRLPALDVRLRRARDEHERGVAGVQVREVRDLVGAMNEQPRQPLSGQPATPGSKKKR